MTDNPLKPAVAIVGLGAVGRVLARALAGAGYPLVALIDRRRSRCEPMRQVNPEARTGTDLSLIGSDMEILLICVPDDQIAIVDHSLRRILPRPQLRAIAHTSGALEASALQSAVASQIPVASLHPLQTFSSEENDASLRGVHFALEGDAEARRILEILIADVGGISFNIVSGQKARYHAAAVFAANFIPVLLRCAAELMASGGVSERDYLGMAAPLIRQSLENCLRIGPAAALTGPVARGDFGTVEKHLEALRQESPATLALYRMLSLKALQLAIERGLPDDVTEKLQRTLAGS